MPLCNEEILPAIIVVIEQVRAPTGKSESGSAQARRVGHIPEAAVAVVAKEVITFVGKIRNHNIRAAVVVVIAEVGPHPGKRFAVLIVGNACGQADFGERAISVVVVQEAWNRIVGDKNVRKTVVVIIGKSYAQPLAFRVCDASLSGNVGKCSVAIIVVEDVLDALKVVGVTVGAHTRFLFSTIRIVPKAPIHITGHEEVKIAVIVVIEKPRTCAPSPGGNSSALRYVRERAVPIIVVERVAAIARHVDVFEAVIVVVAHRYTHRVIVLLPSSEAGSLRHIRECA